MSLTLTTEMVLAGLEGSDRDWAYNGIDVLETSEIKPILQRRLEADPACLRIFLFEMASQNAALTMMLRGAAFDERACALAIKEWEGVVQGLAEKLNERVAPIWDKKAQRTGKCKDGKPHRWSNSIVEWRKHRAVYAELNLPEAPPGHATAVCIKCGIGRLSPLAFNPLSPQQVQHLLYDLLGLPVQHSRKGNRGVTTDDEALDRLIHNKKTSEEDADTLRALLEVRRANKQIGFLRSRRSSDGRLRQSVNVGATESGRWSASKNPLREGTNFQNIADRSRNVIIADPGLLLGYADLEQAESKIVAYDSEDQAYIDAHNAGDVHTVVAKMVWPELPWPGDPKGDRSVADTPAPWDPAHSHRDYAKHVQHGGNIGQSAFGMARDAHIKVKDAEDCYERMYGQAFTGVRRRQREIVAQIREKGWLTNPVGRKRQFFGRPWDPSTHREGLAQTQQSTVADIINLALSRIWWELDDAPNMLHAPRPTDPNRVWLLAQVHDAILFLIRPNDIETLRRVEELMRIPVIIHGKECIIGVEVQLGRNFRHFNPNKPETVGGLASWHYDDATGKVVMHNTKEYLKCAQD